MSNDPSSYYLILPEPSVNPDVTQVILPAHDQQAAIARLPEPLPGEAVRHPITAEVSTPVLDRVFEQLPQQTPTADENASDFPQKVKPAGDEERLAALALMLSGGWVVLDHLEEMNSPDEEEQEDEEPEPES